MTTTTTQKIVIEFISTGEIRKVDTAQEVTEFVLWAQQMFKAKREDFKITRTEIVELDVNDYWEEW